MSRRGLNAAAGCLFGFPLVCLVVLVAGYQHVWGAGGELALLGVILAATAGVGIALAPLQPRLVERMSIQLVQPEEES